MGPPLPPQRPLLNCSSELSCLGLQIDREAINLSSSSPALSNKERGGGGGAGGRLSSALCSRTSSPLPLREAGPE